MSKIYYLSCLPGVGKTRLAVQKMTKHLQGKSGIIVYVAPTILLLNEVRSYLEKQELTKKQASKIRLVTSEGGNGRVSKMVKALLLNESFGDQVLRPLLPGSVILMTHSGFLTLPDSLPRKDEIEVIFDEAHKFTAQLKPVSIKNKTERTLFKTLIAENSTVVLDPEGKETGFKKFKLKTWPHVIKRITDPTANRKQYASLSEVVESALNDRSDVYVKENSRKGHHAFYEVTMPARVFDGYKTVILLSAFLEDTQMWHLLRNKCQLIPLWEHPEYAQIKPRIEKHTNRILNRFSKVCIFPLTTQSKSNSITRMKNAVMVPADSYEKIRAKLEELGISSIKRLLLIAKRLNVFEPTQKELDAIEYLKKSGAKPEPFLWYLKSANNFVETLKAEQKVSGRVLVAVNDMNLKLLSERYPDLTRISTVSHGLNQYLDSNTLIFTAALHPEPEMSILYRALLPGYDYIKDHLADSCTQAVTRLCVRDVQSEVIAYVILPDLATAELLRSKMLNRPIISTRAINGTGMLALSTVNPERKVKRTEKLEGNKHERWRSNELNKKLVSKRASRSRLRRRLKEDPTNHTLIEKIKKIDTELEDLLKSKAKS